MTISGRQYRIETGEHVAMIAEVGAGLRSYTVGGVDVTCSYDADSLPPKGCGMTLAPWPNRLRGGRYTFDGIEQQLGISEPKFGNASHGLGRWARWELVDHSDDAVTLRLDVVPQNGWPHQVRVDTAYSVHAERGLSVEVAAVNTGTTRAPFGTGNHPYLSARGQRLDEVSLTVPAATILDVDDAKIPVGRHAVEGTSADLRSGGALGTRRFDDCFTDLGGSEVTLRTADGGARLWLSDAYRYLQVFTVDELTPGQSGVAIEPMTCPADAFNSGEALIQLEPGESWSGTWGIAPA